MEEAIAALLSQRNVDEAARTAGIGTRTLLRWMKDPEFDKAYRQARRAAFGQCTARLQQASSAAVSAVLKIMVDPAAPHSTSSSSNAKLVFRWDGHVAGLLEPLACLFPALCPLSSNSCQDLTCRTTRSIFVRCLRTVPG